MVRTCDQIKWPLQKGRTRHSTMEKKKRRAKEEMGRQHIRECSGLDFDSSQRAAEDRSRLQKNIAVLLNQVG